MARSKGHNSFPWTHCCRFAVSYVFMPPAPVQGSQDPWRSQMQFIVWKYSKRSYAAMRKVLKNVVSLAVSPGARYDLIPFIPLERSPWLSAWDDFFIVPVGQSTASAFWVVLSSHSTCSHPLSLTSLSALFSPFSSATAAQDHVHCLNSLSAWYIYIYIMFFPSFV